VNSLSLGGSFTYILYNVEDRTEPCGTPACISLGVDISPSTETLNFRSERKELISCINLVENSNYDNLYSRPECHVQEYHSPRHFVVVIKGHVVH
jgi:hypothetical protein